MACRPNVRTESSCGRGQDFDDKRLGGELGLVRNTVRRCGRSLGLGKSKRADPAASRPAAPGQRAGGGPGRLPQENLGYLLGSVVGLRELGAGL